MIERAPQHLQHVRAVRERKLGHILGKELQQRYERSFGLGRARVVVVVGPGPSHIGHGSPAGQSSGPPIELWSAVGAPGRGCSRTATRANAAISGTDRATSMGAGAVV